MAANATDSDAAPDASDLRTSVIVCAFSTARLQQTVTCVTSVLSQSPSPDQMIVVVDHNPELETQLRASLPAGVEVVANAGARGLSSARNTAVELSRGETLVFIDDDAVAHDGWLSSLTSGLESPTVVGVGGRASPLWEDKQPNWFPDEFLWVVGCSYRGLAVSGPVRNPLGCNMAFRSSLFDQVGLFDPGIGRLGSRPLGCEETEFCVRVARAIPGAEVVLVSGAEIDHRVPQERGSPRYYLRRCYYEGISKALVRRLGDPRSLDTERAYVRTTLSGRIARSLGTAVVGPGRIVALGQAGAVVGGLTAAVAGYVFGTIAFRFRPPTMSAPARSRTAEQPV
jgi:glycosyltransferase involved in cell wall biosynthesis